MAFNMIDPQIERPSRSGWRNVGIVFEHFHTTVPRFSFRRQIPLPGVLHFAKRRCYDFVAIAIEGARSTANRVI
jgi:hypothetical protein